MPALRVLRELRALRVDLEYGRISIRMKGATNVYDNLPPWGHSVEVISYLPEKDRPEYEALLARSHRTPDQMDRMYALWERAEQKWWKKTRPTTGYARIQVRMPRPDDWRGPKKEPRRLVIRRSTAVRRPGTESELPPSKTE
jgi:hypothetical protein